MKFVLIAVAIAFIGIVSANPIASGQDERLGVIWTTAQRIADYNYPVETHEVVTSDGYVLTMFRIPYSPKLQNQNKPRPVMFLQHGLLSSSDCWILNGPDNALAYLAADAGYDVWMGNNRGNNYSKKNLFVSWEEQSFWDFSWNEIAIKDMPAMIDYVLDYTNEKTLHYVGHSQGTTAFFVLMSSIPRYNKVIKTSHMLAPVGYMEHMESPLAKAAGPALGHPGVMSELVESNQFLPSTKLMGMLGGAACSSPVFQQMCGNVLFLIAGWDSKHLNYTLMPEVVETHPAGSSTNQLIHYLQEYESGYFRNYDFGLITNEFKYIATSPPKYIEKNIVAPVRFYYGDNDYFAAIVDVLKLAGELPNVVDLYNVPIPQWTHLDFLWALEVKSVIYDRVIAAADYFEKTGKQ